MTLKGATHGDNPQRILTFSDILAFSETTIFNGQACNFLNHQTIRVQFPAVADHHVRGLSVNSTVVSDQSKHVAPYPHE